MATEGHYQALILEAPYSSTLDIAKQRYFFLPVDLLMKDKFLSIEKMDQVLEPLLIIHGTKDRVIPIKLSKQLFAVANEPKTFYEISEAGHNDLYQYGVYAGVVQFLETLQ